MKIEMDVEASTLEKAKETARREISKFVGCDPEQVALEVVSAKPLEWETSYIRGMNVTLWDVEVQTC